MTKFGTYSIKREFNRKTFDTNQKKRHNYVHQKVRFKTNLIIRYGGIEQPSLSDIEKYFGEKCTVEKMGHNIKDYR